MKYDVRLIFQGSRVKLRSRGLQRQGAGEARLKVQKADPFRGDRDSHHLVNH